MVSAAFEKSSYACSAFTNNHYIAELISLYGTWEQHVTAPKIIHSIKPVSIMVSQSGFLENKKLHCDAVSTSGSGPQTTGEMGRGDSHSRGNWTSVSAPLVFKNGRPSTHSLLETYVLALNSVLLSILLFWSAALVHPYLGILHNSSSFLCEQLKTSLIRVALAAVKC